MFKKDETQCLKINGKVIWIFPPKIINTTFDFKFLNFWRENSSTWNFRSFWRENTNETFLQKKAWKFFCWQKPRKFNPWFITSKQTFSRLLFSRLIFHSIFFLCFNGIGKVDRKRKKLSLKLKIKVREKIFYFVEEKYAKVHSDFRLTNPDLRSRLFILEKRFKVGYRRFLI